MPTSPAGVPAVALAQSGGGDRSRVTAAVRNGPCYDQVYRPAVLARQRALILANRSAVFAVRLLVSQNWRIMVEVTGVEPVSENYNL